VSQNPVPADITDVKELVEWFRPLIDAENAAGV
jgi:hypothetical protein